MIPIKSAPATTVVEFSLIVATLMRPAPSGDGGKSSEGWRLDTIPSNSASPMAVVDSPRSVAILICEYTELAAGACEVLGLSAPVP